MLQSWDRVTSNTADNASLIGNQRRLVIALQVAQYSRDLLLRRAEPQLLDQRNDRGRIGSGRPPDGQPGLLLRLGRGLMLRLGFGSSRRR